MGSSMITRRLFATGLVLSSLPVARSFAQKPVLPANRKLEWRVKMDGFGGASEPDIKAVLRSAADELWKYCPNTQFEQKGFEIYHNKQYPISHYEPSPDGYLVVGLAVEGNLWARFSFQFAHEFGHCLMDHANDTKKRWHKLEHANQWLEESICEVASLFSLRGMAQTWKTKPPYPNWKGYSSALADYARQRMEEPKHCLPAGTTFSAWFASEEAGLRKAWAQREKNMIISQQLLPLFDAQPDGWEAITFLKLGTRDVNKTLAKNISEWSANAPAEHRAFISKVAAVFGVKA
jgi:hypothetical protein